MGSQAFSGIAVLVALAFALLAVTACANLEQPVQSAGPMRIAPIPLDAVPEFHDAHIGADALRSRLTAEG